MQIDVHGHLQARHTAAPAFDDPLTAEDESRGDATNAFSLRRARLWVDARAYGFKVRTKIALEDGQARMLSVWVQRGLPGGFKLRLGQHKRNVSMDYIISSPHLRLLERSLASERMGTKRDVGLRLTRPLWRGRVRPMLAIFNGNGPNTLSNDNDALRYELRLDLTPLGRYDLEKPHVGRKLRVWVGGALAWWERDALRKATRPDQGSSGGPRYVLTRRDREWVASAVLAGRWRGLEARGEVFRRQTAPIDALDEARQGAGVSDAQHAALLESYERGREGGYVQLAWRLPWARKLELAARYGLWRPDRDDEARSTDRISATIGWRPRGDKVKVQGGWERARAHRRDTETATTWAWTTQLQLLY